MNTIIEECKQASVKGIYKSKSSLDRDFIETVAQVTDDAVIDMDMWAGQAEAIFRMATESNFQDSLALESVGCMALTLAKAMMQSKTMSGLDCLNASAKALTYS